MVTIYRAADVPADALAGEAVAVLGYGNLGRTAALNLRDSGVKILMGAPNVVRGGSHSGNVSALELAREGTLDALSSDYVPGSLLLAAWLLTSEADFTLPQAIAAVTSHPARACGLPDRGEIRAANNASGGATFSLTLPACPAAPDDSVHSRGDRAAIVRWTTVSAGESNK